MMMAAKEGHPECFQRLLEGGADPAITDKVCPLLKLNPLPRGVSKVLIYASIL